MCHVGLSRVHLYHLSAAADGCMMITMRVTAVATADLLCLPEEEEITETGYVCIELDFPKW